MWLESGKTSVMADSTFKIFVDGDDFKVAGLGVNASEVNRNQQRARAKQKQQEHAKRRRQQEYQKHQPRTIKTWMVILSLSPTATTKQIKRRYRELSKSAHPDTGGSTLRFNELTRAYNEALAYSKNN